MTKLTLVAVVLLALFHEYLAARRSASGAAPVWFRRGVLVVLLLAVAVFGARANLTSRAEVLLSGWRGRSAAPVDFTSAGDPLLADALAAQRPEVPFPEGGSRADIEAWQASTIQRLRELAEFTVPAESPDVEVVRTEMAGEVRRTLIRFTSWDGTKIPAYVHEPPGGGTGAAVLVVPGHGVGIQATAGLVKDYQHSAALALAVAGFVTLTPELRGFGMLAPNGVPSHRVVASAALEAGSFYKAVVGRDLSWALTVLAGWQGVDARLSVAGASLGGELAVFLGVLDERVRVVVSQSYGGALGPTSISESVTDETEQTPHGCHTIPGINRLVWQEDWFRLLAPRPALVVRGTRNTPKRAVEAKAAVTNAFVVVGADEAFSFITPEGGHEFFVEPAALFLTQWLGSGEAGSAFRRPGLTAGTT